MIFLFRYYQQLDILTKSAEQILHKILIELSTNRTTTWATDYGRPERKQPSLHGRKFNPNPKFLGTEKAYFVCHIGPIFHISLSYAFIGCP